MVVKVLKKGTTFSIGMSSDLKLILIKNLGNQVLFLTLVN
jgi:hypothetical protein